MFIRAQRPGPEQRTFWPREISEKTFLPSTDSILRFWSQRQKLNKPSRVHICLLLAKCNFLFERKRGSKAFYSLWDIKSPLKTIDLLGVNESSPHNGDLPSPQNVHALIGKVLSKPKQIFFSTVGPWGSFRPFLLLRVRKTDIRREPGYMCCQECHFGHTWGLKFRLHRKTESLSSHSHSDHSPQHEERTTGSFIRWLSPQPRPPGSRNSLGRSHDLHLGLNTHQQPLTNPS